MSKQITRKRKVLFIFIIFSLFLFISLIFTEFILRTLEKQYVSEGNSKAIYHDSLGWLPEPNTHMLQRNSEFEAFYKINSLSMNDDEFNEGSSTKNILALGDSHTFAVGVSFDKTWPNFLEKKLNSKNLINNYQVLNTGVPGYNLGQYLIRYRTLKERINPEYIIIGFSMATDLYDLIPPRMGGFVYGSDKGRTYFDLDSEDNLVEINELDGIEILNKENFQNVKESNLTLKSVLEKSAIFRRFKRSKLAMRIAVNYKPKGKSLWPGLDTALKINLNEDDKYRWLLAERIIEQISIEAEKNNTKVILVNIPYLAQVYDEVWENSFGLNSDEYNRWIASERLANICKKYNIYFIDTTNTFVEHHRKYDKWFHFRRDAHPTEEGHELIANVIFDHKESGLN